MTITIKQLIEKNLITLVAEGTYEVVDGVRVTYNNCGIEVTLYQLSLIGVSEARIIGYSGWLRYEILVELPTFTVESTCTTCKAISKIS